MSHSRICLSPWALITIGIVGWTASEKIMPLLGTFSKDKTGVELPSISYNDIDPSLQEDISSGDELTLVFKLGVPITNRSVGITPSEIKVTQKVKY